MDYTYYPVKLEDAGEVGFMNSEGTIYVGGAKVTTCYLNHPILCLGYRIEADDRVVCTVYDHEPYVNIFSTDGRLDTDEAREAQGSRRYGQCQDRKHIENADLVIYDSQYHSREEPIRTGGTFLDRGGPAMPSPPESAPGHLPPRPDGRRLTGRLPLALRDASNRRASIITFLPRRA